MFKFSGVTTYFIDNFCAFQQTCRPAILNVFLVTCLVFRVKQIKLRVRFFIDRWVDGTDNVTTVNRRITFYYRLSHYYSNYSARYPAAVYPRVPVPLYCLQ